MNGKTQLCPSGLVAPEKLFEEHEFSLDTRPNDLDILGHVNNAVALEYMEAARWNWATGLGLNWLGSIVVVVSRIEVDYLGPIFAGRIAVKTRLEAMAADWLEDDSYKPTVQQSIFEQNGTREVLRARVCLAFVDTSSQTLCTLQDCWRARVSQRAAQHHGEELSRIARSSLGVDSSQSSGGA